MHNFYVNLHLTALSINQHNKPEDESSISSFSINKEGAYVELINMENAKKLVGALQTITLEIPLIWLVSILCIYLVCQALFDFDEPAVG